VLWEGAGVARTNERRIPVRMGPAATLRANPTVNISLSARATTQYSPLTAQVQADVRIFVSR
jgi:hypothetical protein